MRLSATAILLICLGLFGVATAQQQQSYCDSWTFEDPWNREVRLMKWHFGSNEGGGQPLYEWSLYNYEFSPADIYTNYEDGSLFQKTIPMLNQAPITGGKNMSLYYGNVNGASFIPTANWTCTSNHSGVWGPSYIDYTEQDGSIRSVDKDLEVYVHYSAPTETSYIRTIYFVKNTGATAQRVRLWSLTWTNAWATDISPTSNGHRYYTGFSYEEGDNGAFGSNPASSAYWPSTMHARGQKARDQTANVYGDMYDYLVGTNYATILGAGEEFALMHILSLGTNKTTALKNAAEIDAEPEYIFHDLTADQLAMIRNWGGCQAIIGPTATVTVTPPAQCSTGLTSDFTVKASSSRSDLTAGFTHQVVGIQNVVMVPAQSSTTLSVPNDVGAVRHQLWYKGCLVKETPFNSCSTTA